jgi:hypothetical protein
VRKVEKRSLHGHISGDIAPEDRSFASKLPSGAATDAPAASFVPELLNAGERTWLDDYHAQTRGASVRVSQDVEQIASDLAKVPVQG